MTVAASADGSEPGTFAIGADEATTIANIEAALTAGIEEASASELAAASAIKASLDFFAADLDNPPQRIDGRPTKAPRVS